MKSEFKNKKVSIIGAARSGIAAAEVLKSLGAIPFVSDNGPAKESELIVKLKSLEIEYEFGAHSEKALSCDLLIASPGVPYDAALLNKARAKHIPIWPEIELAYRLCLGRIIGITGSNGKTTTTALVGEILRNAGLPTFVCGNIGYPFVAVAQQIPQDGFAVVELSSFQLELIDKFHPDISVFLNLTPDHLDRHKSLEGYTAAKIRLFENQTADDDAIINYDDDTLRKRCSQITARIEWFSTQKILDNGIWSLPGGEVNIGKTALMKSDDIKIKGEHNLSNACAAVGAALAAGVSKDIIIHTLKTFAGVEHRLEPVRLIGGVSYINDSKGTNVDSVYWALKAVSAPVILIAGGKDKGGDFSALDEIVSKKVRLVILIGQATPKIETTWSRIVKCAKASSLEDAVSMAYREAHEGDTVLLSPGCASFDMFENYEHRGRVFKKVVMELPELGRVNESPR
jgi:UDP-N-acetylmuramoylalanine--D-glutamate ligase